MPDKPKRPAGYERLPADVREVVDQNPEYWFAGDRLSKLLSGLESYGRVQAQPTMRPERPEADVAPTGAAAESEFDTPTLQETIERAVGSLPERETRISGTIGLPSSISVETSKTREETRRRMTEAGAYQQMDMRMAEENERRREKMWQERMRLMTDQLATRQAQADSATAVLKQRAALKRAILGTAAARVLDRLGTSAQRDPAGTQALIRRFMGSTVAAQKEFANHAKMQITAVSAAHHRMRRIPSEFSDERSSWSELARLTLPPDEQIKFKPEADSNKEHYKRLNPDDWNMLEYWTAGPRPMSISPRGEYSYLDERGKKQAAKVSQTPTSYNFDQNRVRQLTVQLFNDLNFGGQAPDEVKAALEAIADIHGKSEEERRGVIGALAGKNQQLLHTLASYGAGQAELYRSGDPGSVSTLLKQLYEDAGMPEKYDEAIWRVEPGTAGSPEQQKAMKRALGLYAGFCDKVAATYSAPTDFDLSRKMQQSISYAWAMANETGQSASLAEALVDRTIFEWAASDVGMVLAGGKDTGSLDYWAVSGAPGVDKWREYVSKLGIQAVADEQLKFKRDLLFAGLQSLKAGESLPGSWTDGHYAQGWKNDLVDMVEQSMQPLLQNKAFSTYKQAQQQHESSLRYAKALESIAKSTTEWETTNGQSGMSPNDVYNMLVDPQSGELNMVAVGDSGQVVRTGESLATAVGENSATWMTELGGITAIDPTDWGKVTGWRDRELGYRAQMSAAAGRLELGAAETAEQRTGIDTGIISAMGPQKEADALAASAQSDTIRSVIADEMAEFNKYFGDVSIVSGIDGVTGGAIGANNDDMIRDQTNTHATALQNALNPQPNAAGPAVQMGVGQGRRAPDISIGSPPSFTPRPTPAPRQYSTTIGGGGGSGNQRPSAGGQPAVPAQITPPQR